MRMLPNTKTWVTLLAMLGFFTLLIREVAREAPTDGGRKTEPIRQNLVRLQNVLLTLERNFESAHDVSMNEQIVQMQSCVETLKDYLLPQLATEEAVLYPAVDRELLRSSGRLTEALKQEHEIMRRWIGEMERLADAPMPDQNAFVRRGERLLGLIEAHFEVEEAVLFPILDQAQPLTRAATIPRP